ncbi:LLM class flavin-dependent oxidoreductase [Mycobacterium sp. 3519A]|uniref:LLM class flavin-dependent oxidoreductase n=1 Tax=Mycobacterium sp. 3519A TaxID=2057184 RepID=UPI000C7E7CF3|nr:LLM class flavin-dependent oxidoreductase [Mycobacterium sp. 3519A]
MQHGVSSHSVGMWRHPQDKVGWDYASPPYWQHLARTLERGLFDALFLADELAPYNSFEDSSDATVRYAVQAPTHEPAALTPIITGATSYLGVGITLSTAFEHPYSMARRLSTFDHLSGGRIAWNIVGSYSPSEFAAYGQDMPDRSIRYERIAEYVDLCCQLWDSWQPDAVVADRHTGVYAHPEKIREVVFEGKHFRCRARHFVAPSPQGRPVLWQAGASEPGRRFAAQTAEAIFAIQPTVASMRAYSDDIRRRVVDAGRDPAAVRLYYGAQVIVADTDAQAREKAAHLRALLRPEATLAMLSGQLGVDFSEFDPATPLEQIPVPGIQGVKDALVATGAGSAVTVAEAAEIYSFRFSMPQVIGSPVTVADQLEEFLDDGGADGFMLLATYTPGCFEEFVDLVVPELQRRGRYRTRYPGATLRENILGD